MDAMTKNVIISFSMTRNMKNRMVVFTLFSFYIANIPQYQEFRLLLET